MTEELYLSRLKLKNGAIRPDQIKFIEAVKGKNALAGFARSVDDALKIVFPEKYK